MGNRYNTKKMRKKIMKRETGVDQESSFNYAVKVIRLLLVVYLVWIISVSIFYKPQMASSTIKTFKIIRTEYPPKMNYVDGMVMSITEDSCNTFRADELTFESDTIEIYFVK